MIYFIADLHLGHKNIIGLANRPFSSVERMDELLLYNWNKKVKGNDTVYILGDLICKSDNPERYLSKLKGKKVLIVGNHDNGWLENIDRSNFLKIEPLIEQSLENRMITMCHYPMLEWRASRKELSCTKLGYLIHGHIHQRFERRYLDLFLSPNALNAGVDVNNFEPVTFSELEENNARFKRQKLLELSNGQTLVKYLDIKEDLILQGRAYADLQTVLKKLKKQASADLSIKFSIDQVQEKLENTKSNMDNTQTILLEIEKELGLK